MKRSSSITGRGKPQRHKHNNRMKKLYELSMMISGDPLDVFKHVVCLIGDLFHVRVVCLSEIRGDELYFNSVYVNGKVSVDVGSCLTHITPCATVKETKDLRLYDCVMEKFPEASFLKEHNAYSYCGFPILDGDSNVIAIICLLDDKPHEFSEEDQELLRIIGQRIALEMERQAHVLERKRIEQTIKKNEDHYRRLVETARAVPWELDIETLQFTYVGPQAEKLLGYPAKKWYEENFWSEHLHPEDYEKAMNFVQKRVVNCNDLDFEYRMLTENGRTVWIRISVNMVQGREMPKMLQGFMFDITPRKNAEMELLANEERLRALFENANDLFHSVSPDGTLQYVNRTWCETLGYTEEEAVGMALFDIIHPDYKNHCLKMFERIMKGEKADYVKTKFLTKDGRAVLLEGSCNCHMVNGAPVSAHSIFRDITKKQKMDDERLRIKNLESIGILAGGIAHDFNNILTGIVGNISMARMYSKTGDQIHKMLSGAEKACNKAGDLTMQLLSFSKGGAPIKETSSIEELIKDTAGFVLKGSNVRCNFSISSDIKPVDIDQGQISQVINNLVINADQATPQGGAITITVENVHISKTTNLPLKNGSYVMITIEDKGIGIPEENLSKIFDPYFTTKNKGTGLGLATTYSIIKKHEGHIQVESTLGTGTTFSIYLPVSEKEVRARSEKVHNVIYGRGKILLMDDEELVQEVAKEMLNSLGYDVELADDGSQAIDTYRKAQKSGRPFDVVIMDLTIPGGMGGKEAVQKLLKMNPKAKAIVSSGYSNDPVISDYGVYGFRESVIKPYKIEELSMTIHKLIT